VPSKQYVRAIESMLGYPPGTLDEKRIELEDIERWRKGSRLFGMLRKDTDFAGLTPKVEMDRDELLAMYEHGIVTGQIQPPLIGPRTEAERLGTVWTLLRRARTAVGTCVVWPEYVT
jgi:hypothetical protein